MINRNTTATIAETEESIQQTLVKTCVSLYGSAKDAYSNSLCPLSAK
jgi:hypothetical protein